MTLQWSCFISYRLGKGKLAVGIINDFYEALKDELELQVDEGVYLSQGELITGDNIDPALEQALCHSACMVLLFTGKYFSHTHTSCAKEYLAMKQLERSRIGTKSSAGKTHGLILPVVLRDLDQLPPELQKRMWCNFEEFRQGEGGITRPKAYFEEISKLSRYIANRCAELRRIPEKAAHCGEFQFPKDAEARRFISDLTGPTAKSGERTSKSGKSR